MTGLNEVREQIRDFNPELASRLDYYDRTMVIACASIVISLIGIGLSILGLLGVIR